MCPSKLPYSSGWSSVCTARWFSFASVGTPFGSAQRHEHAVVLQPEVLVQPPGVVLLDHERLVRSDRLRPPAAGTGSGVLAASRMLR